MRVPRYDMGFTLIELMIVITIIAALAAMVVPRLGERSEQAKITIAESEIKTNLALSLKLYKLDSGRYPTTEQGLNALMTKPSSSPVPNSWSGPYIETEPLDPWKNPYKYKSSSPTAYELSSMGPDGLEGTSDDVKN